MDPGSAYREGAVRGASGAALVVSLYEQAIQDLRRAVAAIEQGDIALRTKHINHAISVIGHLQSTLDRELGGEVSRNLDLYYCSVRRRLIDAHVAASREILYQQITHLLSVREAWIEVERATVKNTSALPSPDPGRDTESFTSNKTLSSDW